MNDFDRILDDCLIQISSGAASLDDCLGRYPEHAAQLRPLLLTTSRLARGRTVTPLPAFKARTRAKLTLHMQAHPRRKRGLPLFWRLAFSTAMLLVACLATGTAYAQSALPGDFFYEWKLASEQVWRALASDTLEVDLILLGRRADELVAVMNDPAWNVQALAAYQEALARLTLQTDAEAQARILAALQSQQESLAQAGITVPELDVYINTMEEVFPTQTPLPVPTVIPTFIPTFVPTLPPILPTLVPTTIIPTAAPTAVPTAIPTAIPTTVIPTLTVPTLPIPPLP